MGRELRRKQAKKEHKSLINEEKKVEEGINFKNLYKILFICIFIVVILYLVLALFFTKELDWFNKDNTSITTNNSSSVTNNILASDTLNQKEDIYYVYFYDYNDEITAVKNIVEDIDDKVYRVNIKDGFNSNYIAEESNLEVEDIKELKVSDVTILKIVDKKIEEYYEGKEAIKTGFGD